jgi:H+-transporting ATPase
MAAQQEEKKNRFEDTPPEETLQQLQTDRDNGLTQDEAQRRLEKYGPNELAEERMNPLWKFLSYFWGPIPWMIEVAAVLSAVLQHWLDLAIIGGLLLFNAAVGFWQEYQASNALEALRKQLALKARVRRDGHWREIEARELVPGDIVRVRLGDVVPADVKLIEGDYLSVDQSALTGESLPVDKKVGDLAYSGSAAKQGEMVGVVTATGGNTFFGRTAKLVAGAGAKSHFQRAVMRVGDFLILVAAVLSVILVIVELFRGVPVLSLLQFVLILVVASVPVAMPAVLSVTMALGALALSRQKAIVSRLQSIEETAGVDILCSDKTGTLTQNKLTLGDPVLFEAQDAQEVILAGALASKVEDRDAIDTAVVAALKDAHILDNYQQKEFVPFDPVSKRTEATVTDKQGRTFQVSKGAPQVILDLCALKDEDKKRAEQTVNDLAAKGNRTLGVARDGTKGQWHFLGILPMFDPPREDSAETIRHAREHGIVIKMVTGDNVAIAREIAGQLGLGRDIHPAEQLFPPGTDVSHISAEAERRIEQAAGFAQVFPEHKYGIVKALQGKGHIVAMTGDGVNDAPALKQADMGIAVSGATDAARSAASLILTEPGLSVIIKAVDEARRIFERMMSYTIYRITMTLDIMIFVVLAILVFNFFPLTTIMIILLALLDDIPIMTIAYDNTRLDRQPVRWDLHRTIFISSVLGFFAIIETFGLLLITMLWLNLDLSEVRTTVFLQLVAGGHLMLFLTRTKEAFWRRPYPSGPLLLAIIGTQVLAVLLSGFGLLIPAIPWWVIGVVWGYNIVWMFVEDLIKIVAYRLIGDQAKHKSKYLETVNRPLHHHPTR